MEDTNEPYEPYTVVRGNELEVCDSDGGVVAGEAIQNALEESDDQFVLGHQSDLNQGLNVVTTDESTRYRHTAYFGVTGYGKSRSVRGHLTQAISRGEGVTYIDPKGDDVQQLLKRIPEHRVDDIVVLDPSQNHRTSGIGFNLFETSSSPEDESHETESTHLVDAFMDILRSGSSGWSQQIDALIRDAAYALITSPTTYTFVDLQDLLTTEPGREELLTEFGDEFSDQGQDLLESDDALALLDPVIRRIQTIVDNEVVSNLLAQSDAPLTLRELLESDKIVLYDGSGLTGEIQSAVAGCFLRSLWAAARSRTGASVDERPPHTIAIDEADLVINHEAINTSDMLSKGRALRTPIVLAAQQPSQFEEDTRLSVFGNCGTLLIFNPGPSNHSGAHALADAFPNKSANELMELDQFQFSGRTAENTTLSAVETFPELPPKRTSNEASEIASQSKSRYGL